MSIEAQTHRRPEAYSVGASMLLVAVGVIVAALGFEHIGGYIPCPLCLQQRYAYYIGVPLLFFALVMLSASRPKIAGAIFLLVAFGFLINAGLGVYQAGAEWKFWPGPETCAGDQGVATTAADLFKQLEQTKVVRCDEANWRFGGLSFAGWNAVVSLMLFVAGVKAAFATESIRN